MAGKREKKSGRTRLPGILMLLAGMVAVLVSTGPAGIAADSPVETPQELEVEVVEVPAAEIQEIAPAEEIVPEEPPEPAYPVGLVAESAAVEDTYFDTVAFLGDSRTEGFYLYSGMKSGAYYYAVGATVESVFSKDIWETANGKVPLLDALADTECQRIYVMLGVNELGWAKGETFRDQYAKVIDRIRQDHPESVVVIQSLLPVSAKQDAKGSYVNNERIRVYNELLLELAAEKGCPYVDSAAAVSDETGCLRSEWTFDGVHLNVKGCKAWLEYLRTHGVFKS